MIIDDLNIDRTFLRPYEADAPAGIEADRMLTPTVAHETFQFACRCGFDIIEIMCAVQHIELAQRCIRVAAMSFSKSFAHEQTFSGATLEPKYHQLSCGYTPHV
jgi:hypothetical protein